MSEHRIALEWTASDAPFTYEAYTRNHTIRFKDGQEVLTASASPVYRGDGSKADPEDMLVAALSSCHMLSFLAIACKKKSPSILTRTMRWDFWKVTARNSGWRG